jgi:hypothetical protein
MRTVSFRIPEIGFLAGTRVALGVGLGLILARKLSSRRRKRLGWTLLGIGAATTVPFIAKVTGKGKKLFHIVA